LKVSHLFDNLVSDFPLNYTSNNAPKPRDIILKTAVKNPTPF
jgi:hypothetical protein